MTVVILQIAAGLIGVLTLMLRQYYTNAPQREEEKENEEREQGRKDIADGNTYAVQSRLKRLLSKSNNSTSGRENGTDKKG